MFSGIIQTKSKVFFKNNTSIGIFAPNKKVKLGDSIAINGVCLTVVRKKKVKGKNALFFDVSKETKNLTTIDKIHVGDRVNVEVALSAKDLLGGHIVQGHVDGTAKILKIQRKKNDVRMTLKPPKSLKKYIVSKGSVTLDGVSLTVAGVSNGHFSVALIDYTLSHTNLGSKKSGDLVNLETDVLAKYVHKYTKR